MRTGVLLLLVLADCRTSQEVPNTDHPMRYLALGDSYTIGESVPPEQRWPVLLADALRAHGLDVAPPQLIARTGWTTDELDAAITAADPQGPFDLVSLLIGVNNQYRGRSADEYREQFRALLHRAIGFAGGRADRVLVLSIPDWGTTPFAGGRDRAQIAAELDRFNEINREETAAAGAHYVNITPISREHPGLVADDGLHPSGTHYALWAEAALPVVRTMLGGD